jgi:hypothetical protein
MTSTPTLPSEGGSYIRNPDGSLIPESAPEAMPAAKPAPAPAAKPLKKDA